MIQEFTFAGVGLIVTALTGVTALGVKRILQHTDELKGDSKRHGEEIAAMKVMLPNGEWRELQNTLSTVHGAVREVQLDVSGVKGDVTELRLEFKEHAMTEKDRMCEAIEETYPRLRPVLTFQPTRKRKSKKVSK